MLYLHLGFSMIKNFHHILEKFEFVFLTVFNIFKKYVYMLTIKNGLKTIAMNAVSLAQ